MILPILALQLAVVMVVCLWAVDSIRAYVSPVPVAWGLVLLVRIVAAVLLWWLVSLPPFHSLG